MIRSSLNWGVTNTPILSSLSFQPTYTFIAEQKLLTVWFSPLLEKSTTEQLTRLKALIPSLNVSEYANLCWALWFRSCLPLHHDSYSVERPFILLNEKGAISERRSLGLVLLFVGFLCKFQRHRKYGITISAYVISNILFISPYCI